jgi:pyruvate dehydrogenase E2 component (dihydrolipoamide acetyltransferase)
MPQIGQDVETGVITRWNKKVGDPVQKGEAIATVEGDKAAFDIEADASGVLLQIVVEQGQEGKVLEVVGYIGEPGEKPATRPAAAGLAAVAASPASQLTTPPTAETTRLPRGRLFSSPSARRTAQELGVNLGALAGSGPGGRIVKKDVLAAAPTNREGRDTVVPYTRMRQTIAERLSMSKATIPHFYLFQDIDLESALVWREQYNRLNGTRVTVTDLVVQAAALALREHPRLNAHVEKDHLVVRGGIDIGVAVATEDGLLVPVIPAADTRDIRELSAQIKARSEQARQGRLDLSVQGSFTVSTLGMYGTSSFLPIINPPEAAILGVGAAEPRPVAVNGLLGIHRVMTVTLACDHRAVNGAEAARFLQCLRGILSEPGGKDR